MATVVSFPGKTILALPPDQVLERAMGQLDAVVVIGQDRQTGEVYVAGSHDLAETILSIERAKRALLAVADE